MLLLNDRTQTGSKAAATFEKYVFDSPINCDKLSKIFVGKFMSALTFRKIRVMALGKVHHRNFAFVSLKPKRKPRILRAFCALRSYIEKNGRCRVGT